MDFTIIVQGKLSIFTALIVLKYKDDFKIVVSTPNNSDPKLAKEIFDIASKSPNVSVVFYDPEVLIDGYDNTANRFYHFFSTYTGLSITKTKYAIKMRSDEYYSDLRTPIREIKRNPKKIITNDVFFRKSYIYHPSDHLVGGTTDIMTKVFFKAMELCKSPEKLELVRWKKSIPNKPIAPEQILGLSVLDTLIKDEDELTEYELMSRCFEIIPSEDLGFFKVTYNSVNKEFNDMSFFNKETDIKNLEELKSIKR